MMDEVHKEDITSKYKPASQHSQLVCSISKKLGGIELELWAGAKKVHSKSLRLFINWMMPHTTNERTNDESNRIGIWHDLSTEYYAGCMRAELTRKISQMSPICHQYTLRKICFLRSLAPAQEIIVVDIMTTLLKYVFFLSIFFFPVRHLLPYVNYLLDMCYVLRDARFMVAAARQQIYIIVTSGNQNIFFSQKNWRLF